VAHIPIVPAIPSYLYFSYSQSLHIENGTKLAALASIKESHEIPYEIGKGNN
jgi:hypothetical protein